MKNNEKAQAKLEKAQAKAAAKAHKAAMKALPQSAAKTPLARLRRHVNFRRLLTLCMYLLLLDLVFVFLYPFLYMLVTSFKSQQDLDDVTVTWLLNTIDLSNYKLAFQVLNYPRRLLNTVIAVTLCTVGHVLSCAFIGYGFARYNFRGKNFFFGALLLSMIVPTQTIIVPLYILFSNLGWIGTQLPVILPTYFGFGLKGALFIFIFRQFFLSLPKSLEEAAYIDGCGAIRGYFRIAFPTSRSSVLVCIVLSMVWHWNDFFEPTLYLQEQSKYYLSLVLPTLSNLITNSSSGDLTSSGAGLENLYTDATMMAAVTLTVLPIFVIYMFLQKQFMQGIETSGITGE